MAQPKRHEELGPLGPDMVRELRGPGVFEDVPIYKARGWSIVDRPGKFMQLPKSSLGIDPDYQREDISETRINDIARAWSWAALGALSVASRPGGGYWVFDGQHRFLAAQKRSDITMLPCMVYQMADIKQEAASFVRANTVRGAVKIGDRHKAALLAEDPVALAAEALVGSCGYRFDRDEADRVVSCVGSVIAAIRVDAKVADAALRACAALADGKHVGSVVFNGLLYVERYMSRRKRGSLLDEDYLDRLRKIELAALHSWMRAAERRVGKGGQKVWGEAAIDLLDKGRRRKRIRPLETDDE
jgi:hypothetical protein